MDRRVKERLVGASILVVLIVLIVPELLSGPPRPTPAPVGPRLPVSAPEPVRNVTVDLATNKAPEPPAAETAASSAQPTPETPGAEAASAGGDASTSGNAAPPVETPPSTDVQPSADTPTADARPSANTHSPDIPASAPLPRPARPVSLETAPPAPISASARPAMTGRSWAVQLGSFASRDNADKLVRQLKARGFSVYVVPAGSGPSLRYRVRIGPMADRGAATQAAAKLKSLGQTPSLVAPPP